MTQTGGADRQSTWEDEYGKQESWVEWVQFARGSFSGCGSDN